MEEERKPRIVEATPQEQLATAVLAIMTVPRGNVGDVNAFVTLPGQGEVERVAETIRRWQIPGSKVRHLVVAGHNHGESTMEVLSLARLGLSPYHLRRYGHDSIVIGGHEKNTATQVAWVADQVKEREIRSLALFVSAYHLPRGYMTLLKALAKRDIRIPMIPVPVCTDLSQTSPQNDTPMWHLLPAEGRRTLEYQEKGDVASFEELYDYLAWLYLQPLIYLAETH